MTNYWEPFFRPDCRATAAEQNISCRRHAYDVERRQGQNVADAAATVVDSLAENGFLVSTLSHAGRSTRGGDAGALPLRQQGGRLPVLRPGHASRAGAEDVLHPDGVFHDQLQDGQGRVL